MAILSPETVLVSRDLLAEFGRKRPSLDSVLFRDFDAARTVDLTAALEQISRNPDADAVSPETWAGLSSLFRTIGTYTGPFTETVAAHGTEGIYRAANEIATYAEFRLTPPGGPAH